MRRIHPRIYPVNYAIIERYGPDHPAARVLQTHAEASDMCVGKEVEWPQLGNCAIEQTWFSRTRLKMQSFSAFAYEFISYDLILDGWLEMGSEPTETEANFLEADEPLMSALPDECEEAAHDDDNAVILPLIAKSREFVRAYKAAIMCRFDECPIEWPTNPQDV